jgi:hypothetical protein
VPFSRPKWKAFFYKIVFFSRVKEQTARNQAVEKNNLGKSLKQEGADHS